MPDLTVNIQTPSGFEVQGALIPDNITVQQVIAELLGGLSLRHRRGAQQRQPGITSPGSSSKRRVVEHFGSRLAAGDASSRQSTRPACGSGCSVGCKQ